MTMRKLILFITMLAAGLTLRAQTVEWITIEKLTDYLQTGDSSTILRPYDAGSIPVSAPYWVRMAVEGSGLEVFTPPAFSSPAGSGVTGGVMALDPYDNEWKYRMAYADKTSMDTAFNNGAFVLMVNGTSVNLTLGGAANADVYPNAPHLGFDAAEGIWSGALLTVNPGNLTFTSNTFSGFGSAGLLNHIGIYLMDSVGNEVVELHSFSDNTQFPGALDTDSLGGAYDLVAGETYFMEVEFNTVVGISNEYTGANNWALFTSRTQMQIQAVPEPATYAALLGALSLLAAASRRRRQT
jgi:hypothetical protein